jgi:hypothetical protein
MATWDVRTMLIPGKMQEISKEIMKYRVIPSVLDPRKCEYLKDYSLDFE